MTHDPPAAHPDVDPTETSEWLEALQGVLDASGRGRTRFLMGRLMERAHQLGIPLPALVQTPFVNTIAPDDEPPFPGDEQMERRIRRLIRWNAVAQVVRANQLFVGLGGHLSTYASAASLYEVGFNHFFRGKDAGPGDQLFVQGHAAPGIYARAYLEGRLAESQLERFRRESEGGAGLSSYPHPRLMPEFWEFPTVSMGLGPINAIYQARFNRYLHQRGIADTSGSRVWAFLGDGECDEPESLGSLSLAAREKLDNLIFVVNCNLQRLDGPVRGNGKIIQELEAVFHGAGWNVIKVVWGREWDPIFARDEEHVLIRRLGEIVDGEFQRFAVESGDYIRRRLTEMDERLGPLFEPLSDDEIVPLRRGGHDYRKIYAAYQRAVQHEGQPTVILAHTIKGWTLGGQTQARNITHQVKMLGESELRAFRDRLQLPIPDAELENPPFYHPGPDSEEVQYLLERRKALGGFLPSRRVQVSAPALPGRERFAPLEVPGPAGVPFSTTMAFVRLFRELLKEPELGPRLVPIISDEARTFGMEALFRQIGIYACEGQRYEPVDHDLMLSYRESKDGQILEEGITECGSLASFAAAGTSYATHGQQLIPFFIFYSMFGFQRVGDSIWSAADQRARGFLLGATAGRTTLNGEGLQHQDGHSPLVASCVPCCQVYDPGYHYELAVIVRDGLRRMVREQEDVFYYITLYNENYDHPALPSGAEEGIVKGLYCCREPQIDGRASVRLLGSGSILPEVLRAAETLEEQHGIAAQVFSATSYSQLRRDALAWERARTSGDEAELPLVRRLLAREGGPVVATSDFVRAVPDQIARWVDADFTSLGTDGFGLSDTRVALRRYFGIDRGAIVTTALERLSAAGAVSTEEVAVARREYGIDVDADDPTDR